jgi:hypothetical protein
MMRDYTAKSRRWQDGANRAHGEKKSERQQLK